MVPAGYVLTETGYGISFIIKYINAFPTGDDDIFLSIIIHVRHGNMGPLHKIPFRKSLFYDELIGISFVDPNADKNIVIYITGNTESVVRFNPVIVRIPVKKRCIFCVLHGGYGCDFPVAV